MSGQIRPLYFPIFLTIYSIINCRFDPLCGEFDKKQFAENYNFLSDIRIQDIRAIRAELKETTDPDRILKLKRLLQRLNEQHKAGRKARVEQQNIDKQKEEVEKVFKQGKQPYFKNKCKHILWILTAFTRIILYLLYFKNKFSL